MRGGWGGGREKETEREGRRERERERETERQREAQALGTSASLVIGALSSNGGKHLTERSVEGFEDFGLKSRARIWP